MANVCVESTARSAYERAYNVTVLGDAVAALSVAEMESALRFSLPHFSQIRSVAPWASPPDDLTTAGHSHEATRDDQKIVVESRFVNPMNPVPGSTNSA